MMNVKVKMLKPTLLASGSYVQPGDEIELDARSAEWLTDNGKAEFMEEVKSVKKSSIKRPA